ncbi:MAG: type III pantothenate kinase [Deltaproteobacteria bacterium]|nr:type III pantothenate kinase [Deltaproteobacteria bacterium]
MFLGVLLVLDVGNTDTVLGLFKGSILFFHKRVPSQKLKDFFLRKKIFFNHVDSAIVSSVVPAVDPLIRKMLQKLKIKKRIFVTHRLKLPISLKVDRPGDVGADRLVNNSGAFVKYGGPLLVIDLGTATTIDYVDSKGAYRGGVIIPGLKISAQALFERASKLPSVPLEFSSKILGTNTVFQMQSGIVHGYIAMLEGMIRKIQKEIKKKPKIIMTGGLGSLVAPHVSFKNTLDPFLTLRGLKLLARLNA